jgi:hypothetical protein
MINYCTVEGAVAVGFKGGIPVDFKDGIPVA